MNQADFNRAVKSAEDKFSFTSPINELEAEAILRAAIGVAVGTPTAATIGGISAALGPVDKEKKETRLRNALRGARDAGLLSIPFAIMPGIALPYAAYMLGHRPHGLRPMRFD